MSSRCQEAVESSRCLVRRGMWCVLLSMIFKPQQSMTPTAEMKALWRPSPRRSSHAVQDLRRMASRQGPYQDQRPSQGHLPPSHRKARPAPSSGRAQGLFLGELLTLPRSRGGRSGTTWRGTSRHISFKKVQGKEDQTLRSSSQETPRSYRSRESCAAAAASPP